MLALQNTPYPTDEIVHIQPNVTARCEAQNLGHGTLYLTEHTVTWQNQIDQGFVLNYPAIAVHAINRANGEEPESSLYLLVDIKKAELNYRKDGPSEDDDEEVQTLTIRFIPDDEQVLHNLYSIMNDCQEANPDPEEEDNEHGGGFDIDIDEPVDGAGDSGHQWYTADNVADVDNVMLTEEGHANLMRMLGGAAAHHADSNGHGRSQDDDEEMDADA